MYHMRIIALLVMIVLCTDCQSLETTIMADEYNVILVTPNLDDDDNDGLSDAEDAIINGPQDKHDLTAVEVPIAKMDFTPVIEGQGATLYRIIETIASTPEQTILYLEAKRPRSKCSLAILKIEVKSPSIQDMSFRLDVKPFVLTSPVDKASEVFIVKVPQSVGTIRDLKDALSIIPNAPSLTILDNEEGTKTDVWIQDATEIGLFQGTTISAAFAGLRGKHNNPRMNPKALDMYFMETFCGPERCVLYIGKPLPKRRWIDWFGNLESTPPFVDRNGIDFPWGRVLVGQQKELAMHDDVMDFLENQTVQWPPIVMDTGFLHIGHVDEIVNFVATKNGFKAILASPSLGWHLLERLASDGYGREPILSRKATRKNEETSETTVANILNDKDLKAANDAAAKVMATNCRNLMREMNLQEADVIQMPIVFKGKGKSLWPNPVNGLVIGQHYIASKPFGPLIDGYDQFEEACRSAFDGTDIVVHFVDAYEAYTTHAGEIHCGTNAIRLRTVK